MVQVDTSESKAEGGAGGVEAGEYHWVIDDVTVESFEGVQSLKIVSSVLAGHPDGQVGHKHTEFFNLGGKSVDRLRRLLVATNLMTEEEWVSKIGQSLQFDEEQLRGKQYCARVKLEPYKGKKEEHKGKSFPRIGFDIWNVADEKAKHIPKSHDMLALIPGHQARPAEVSSAKAASQPQSAFKW